MAQETLHSPEVVAPPNITEMYHLSRGLLKAGGVVGEQMGLQRRTFGWNDPETDDPYLVYETRRPGERRWNTPRITRWSSRYPSVATVLWLGDNGAHGVLAGGRMVGQAREAPDLIGSAEASLLRAARSQVFRMCAEIVGAEPTEDGWAWPSQEQLLQFNIDEQKIVLRSYGSLDPGNGAPFIHVQDGLNIYEVSPDSFEFLGSMGGTWRYSRVLPDTKELTRLMHMLPYCEHEPALSEIVAGTPEYLRRVGFNLRELFGRVDSITESPVFEPYSSNDRYQTTIVGVMNEYAPGSRSYVPHALGVAIRGGNATLELAELPTVGRGRPESPSRLRVDLSRGEAVRRCYANGILNKDSIVCGDDAAASFISLLHSFTSQVAHNTGTARPYTGAGEYFRSAYLKMFFED